MYILYIENPLKLNQFSINLFYFCFVDGGIDEILPVHIEESQQKYKKKSKIKTYKKWK